ncbi:MAG: hypothetical protein QM705_00165 [Ancrocorticia sp.]
MNDNHPRELLEAIREDSVYHQARVLLLVVTVTRTDGHSRKLDGLTKLAKLDFLVRYPALALSVLDCLDPHDEQLHLTDCEDLALADVGDPMIRYKYGPWDDRYYPVIGALVGRNLIKFVKGRRGSVAFSPTPLGKKIASFLSATPEWRTTSDRCEAVARASSGLNGNKLRELIYQRLPELMDQPYRKEIR